MKQSNFWYEIGLLTTVLIWGINFGVTKYTIGVIHPFLFNAYRFTISIVFLTVVFVRTPSFKTELKHFFKNPLPLIAMGALGHLVYQIGFLVGIDHTTSGNAALIIGSTPVWTGLYGRMTNLESLSRLAWAGIFVSLVGIIIIVLGSEKEISFANEHLFGNLVCLFGAISWGIYTAISKPFLNTYSPTGLSYFTLLPLMPVWWVIASISAPIHLQAISFDVWGALIFSGILSTGVAYIIWNQAIKQVGASQTAIYSNLVPMIALISGFIFLGESIVLGQLFGGVLVLFGLYLMRRARNVLK